MLLDTLESVGIEEESDRCLETSVLSLDANVKGNCPLPHPTLSCCLVPGTMSHPLRSRTVALPILGLTGDGDCKDVIEKLSSQFFVCGWWLWMCGRGRSLRKDVSFVVAVESLLPPEMALMAVPSPERIADFFSSHSDLFFLCRGSGAVEAIRTTRQSVL